MQHNNLHSKPIWSGAIRTSEAQPGWSDSEIATQTIITVFLQKSCIFYQFSRAKNVPNTLPKFTIYLELSVHRQRWSGSRNIDHSPDFNQTRLSGVADCELELLITYATENLIRFGPITMPYHNPSVLPSHLMD